MPPILRLLRPKQWTKNLLVFAPLLFTAAWGNAEAWTRLGLAFLALCFLSAATYVVNDIRDAERDRLHPKKRLRPVASGEVSTRTAWAVAGICLALGAGIGFGLGQAAFGLLVFFAIHLLYNFFAKRQPVLDVVTISLGYVLRPVVGAMVMAVPVSGWLVFCTGAIALLLATGKRRQEFMNLGGGGETRAALQGYSRPVLDGMVVLGAALSVLSYGIYAIESPTAALHPDLIATVPFVLYGVLRYMLLIFQSTEGEEPESTLFGDPHMISTLVLFTSVAIWAMSRGSA